MSKINSLLKQTELFEKLSLYGDRKDFLRALGQGTPEAVSDADLGSATSQLYGAIENWIENHAEKQADVAGGLIAGLPPALRNPVQVIRNASVEHNFDADTLPVIYQAARDLAAVANLGNTGDDAKKAWMQIVFPQASHLIDLAGKQMSYVKWWKENYAPAEEQAGEVTIPETEITGKVPARKMPF